MSLNVTNTKEMNKTGISVLIYAESGTGKTTLVGTLPGKTLLIDLEGGTRVLEGKDIDVIPVETDLSNFAEILNTLQTEDTPYDNICIDSITELEKRMVIAFTNARGKSMPEIGDYGKAAFKMREYLRAFRDLTATKGKNVIFNALEMRIKVEENDGLVRTKTFPMMMEKLAPEAAGMVDIVGHMEIDNRPEKEGFRYIRLVGTEKNIAKDRVYPDRKYCRANGSELLFNKVPKEETAKGAK